MKYLDESNYKASVANGACVVTFGAPWCPDCVRVKPMLEKLEGEFGEKISFFGVDFDSALGLKDELNIRRIPTLIFYKDGKEVGERLVEPNSHVSIQKALENLL